MEANVEEDDAVDVDDDDDGEKDDMECVNGVRSGLWISVEEESVMEYGTVTRCKTRKHTPMGMLPCVTNDHTKTKLHNK